MAGFFKKLINKITNKAEIDWDELEADLIASDLGARLTMTIVDELQGLGRKISGDDVVEVTKQHIERILPDDAPALLPRPPLLFCDRRFCFSIGVVLMR